jgi:hypothetical protein
VAFHVAAHATPARGDGSVRGLAAGTQGAPDVAMTSIKRLVALCAVVGLVGCFLPLASRHGLSISFFTLRRAPGHALDVWAVVFGFLAPLVAAASEARARTVALVATAGFGVVIWTLGFGLLDIAFTSLGGLAMTAGALAGIATTGLLWLASGAEKAA